MSNYVINTIGSQYL